MALYIVRGAKKLRVEVGEKQLDLAHAAGLGVATVRNVEKGIGASERSAYAIYRVLNAWHDGSLDSDLVCEVCDDENE